MKKLQCTLRFLLALCLTLSLSASALASTFTDAHGNEIELDDSLEAYANEALLGAEDAARKAETNLGDLWADALRWFAVSGNINAAFDEDDVKAGNDKLDVDAEHVVALWNAGNLRANIPAGKFGAAELAEVLPYPNKVAVVYMTGAQLAEALEALENVLCEYAGTLLVISHDRRFVEKIATRLVFFHGHSLETFEGTLGEWQARQNRADEPDVDLAILEMRMAEITAKISTGKFDRTVLDEEYEALSQKRQALLKGD